ncbi:MAG: ParA family protein [Actinomycetota bacterium]|nr:ParA family protein [Actinomycetota bacterium]
MEKIVFFNTKGGTGKTTLCYNFGWYLASKKNKKILFMDFDPQINLVQAFGIQRTTDDKKNMDNLMIDKVTPIVKTKYRLRYSYTFMLETIRSLPKYISAGGEYPRLECSLSLL